MIVFIEPFWEKASLKRMSKKLNSRDFNSLQYNKYPSYKYGGINSMVEYGPVEPETGVRFSYTALILFRKRPWEKMSVNGKAKFNQKMAKGELRC